MCEGADDEACGFNPWFAYLREVKAQARGRLAAGEDPEEIRRGFIDRIGGGGRHLFGITAGTEYRMYRLMRPLVY